MFESSLARYPAAFFVSLFFIVLPDLLLNLFFNLELSVCASLLNFINIKLIR